MTKRPVSILIPYRLADGALSIYLQKRSADMKNPNSFSFWGGGLEDGETFEQGLLREIKEELAFALQPGSFSFFCQYESFRSIKQAFLFEAPAGWENGLVVGEGEYGQWFTSEEIMALSNCILQDKVIVNDLERYFLQKPLR